MEKDKSKGFTLLELIVVLVIVGLMAGMVIPRLMGSFTTIMLRSTTRETATLLRQSRDTAYFKKRQMKVSFDLDAENMMIFRYQEESASESRESYLKPKMVWTRITDFSFPEKIKIARCVKGEDVFEDGRFEIFFSPDGNSSGGKIFLQDHRGRESMVSIDLMTGTIRISEE